MNFIFHTAFCCSTLLARCLDVPGINLSLKEPTVLPSISNARRVWRRTPEEAAEWNAVFVASLKLLGRRFVADEAVTIKPTNQCNNLVRPLRETLPGARVLLLYSDVRRFLVSILKRGEPGMAFVRRLLATFLMEADIRRSLFPSDPGRLTDLQAAALIWVIQMAAFADAVRAAPANAVRTLDCQLLLNAPEQTLASVARHFELRMTAHQMTTIIEGPAFRRDSKFSEAAYDEARRLRDTSQIEHLFGREIDATLAWAAMGWPNVDPSGALGNAL